jgi:uncharacterized membrane protein
MPELEEMGKLLVLAGIGLALAGLLVIAAARLGWRRFPGTFFVAGKHVTFVFPVLLCVVLSLLLTLILSLWRR